MPSTRKSHLAEIVRDSDKTLKTLSLSGSSSTVSAVDLPGWGELRYVDQSLLDAVRFPPARVGNRRIRKIVEGIEEVVCSVAMMDESSRRRLALFVVATWFSECLSVPPMLVLVTAQPEEGLSLFLTLSALCRRSALLDGEAARSFSADLSRLCATTFVDATAAKESTLRCFGGLNARGILRTEGRTLFDGASCRVLLGCEPLPISSALQEFVLPKYGDCIPSDSTLDNLANEHAADLLGYRLRFIERFPQEQRIAHIPRHVPNRRICSNLQSCIFSDDDLQASIPILFENTASCSATDRDADVEHAVAQVLFIFAHEAGARVLSLGQIQQRLDHLAALRGFEDNAVRKKIAKAVARIGVQTHRRNSGIVIIVDDWADQVVHARAAALAAINAESLQANCRLCEELRPLLRDPGGAAPTKVNDVKQVKVN